VSTFLSINGVNAGVGAVPYCRPSAVATAITFSERRFEEEELLAYTMCDLLMEQASHAAYTEFAQLHSFQANYWRDPRPVARERYQQYSQLAKLNNEGTVLNQTLRDNYAKTETFVWVMAQDDNMVWPAEGEHWGAPDPQNPFTVSQPMKKTEWYQDDLFGLRTADEAGKNFFESFPGDHLQFEMEDLHRWITKYFTK
jgi:palmitoyl-protein thioesterase